MSQDDVQQPTRKTPGIAVWASNLWSRRVAGVVVGMVLLICLIAGVILLRMPKQVEPSKATPTAAATSTATCSFDNQGKFVCSK